SNPRGAHLCVYAGRTPAPYPPPPPYRGAGWWWRDAELRAHLRDPAWPFVPDTRVIVDDLLTEDD
ncbi:NUDIX hydrolase, partial [Nocardia sp. NPDC058497]